MSYSWRPDAPSNPPGSRGPERDASSVTEQEFNAKGPRVLLGERVTPLEDGEHREKCYATDPLVVDIEVLSTRVLERARRSGSAWLVAIGHVLEGIALSLRNSNDAGEADRDLREPHKWARVQLNKHDSAHQVLVHDRQGHQVDPREKVGVAYDAIRAALRGPLKTHLGLWQGVDGSLSDPSEPSFSEVRHAMLHSLVGWASTQGVVVEGQLIAGGPLGSAAIDQHEQIEQRVSVVFAREMRGRTRDSTSVAALDDLSSNIAEVIIREELELAGLAEAEQRKLLRFLKDR